MLPINVLKEIKSAKLEKTTTLLCAFGDHQVVPLGNVTLDCTTDKGDTEQLLFFVADSADVPLLGHTACDQLNLVKRVYLCQPMRQPQRPSLTNDEMIYEYKDVFTGVGQYEKEYNIELVANAQGVIQPPRKIPYAIQPKVKEALDGLKAQNIIADVDRPTDWVSNLVIVEKKSGALTLCLDPRPLNVAIKRERHAIPTPGDVQAQLSGMKVFTVVDMKDCYWHVKLSDESSYYCTFNTPWGRKRFLRMPFGISSASEIMQKRNEETFGDIQGVHVIADDLIIAARDDQEHDDILHRVLTRARDKGVKFNSEKVQFKIGKVEYMGNLVPSDGLKPDPKKIEAIMNMPKPTDVNSLQRLLGLIKYLAQYIPNESAITEPLRELLKKDAEWDWQPEHDKAIEILKAVLTSKPSLAFYDVNSPVTIQADASQSGLGACLMQKGKPFAYASRAMTSAEQNYAQIEKEMVAICFATSKFHQYVYGKPNVSVQTDHKPLESILKKPLCKALPRLQRLMLRLQPYDLDVHYVPGKYMYLADTLSRAYIQGESSAGLEDELSRIVHSLVVNIPVSASKLSEIRQATEQDPTLRKVKDFIVTGWPKSRKSVQPEVQNLWNTRDELHIAEDVIFVVENVLIPAKLRQQMLRLVHESHMGAEKPKARARTVMYWPGMSKDIEDEVSKCSVCMKYQKSQHRETMLPHDIADGRWQKIAMDIMTYHGRDYLVIVDYYSKYPEVSLLPDKTASSIITYTKGICARHGIPEEILSDNMPFGSREFKDFAYEWGIKTTTSSPTYAQSNGQAERCMQILKGLLKKADEDGRDPYLALLEYGNTPVAGLQYTPSQMLMSRLLRSKLPTKQTLLQPNVVDAHRDLQCRQQRQKTYYDKSASPLQQLNRGDVVRVQKGNVWEPAVVTGPHIQPRSYLVQSQHRQLRRNRRHLYKTNEASPSFASIDGTAAVRHPPRASVVSPEQPRDVPAAPPEPDNTQETQSVRDRFTRSGRIVKTPVRYQ